MSPTTRRIRRLFRFFVSAGLTFVDCGWSPARLNAQVQVQGAPVNASFASSGQQVDTERAVASGRVPVTPLPLTPAQGGDGVVGLIINPTFNANVDAATQTVINNAIAFYRNTFTTNITVNIEFHNMNTGLGSSSFVVYSVPYSSYRTALGTNASSADDAVALANTPAGAFNPINGSANLDVKSANGRALGLNTPEVLMNSTGSPCPAFTGAGCIGINVTLANSIGNLTAVVEHEIDEILSLGSALSGTTTPANPWAEDLFRWASPGVRSYNANASTTNPCSAPSAFFSIDGGVTNLNQFNNCNNGGDYGDWITHTPSQVQDAITNFSASPFLTVTSSEVRALDVTGYSLFKKGRGQITSN